MLSARELCLAVMVETRRLSRKGLTGPELVRVLQDDILQAVMQYSR